MASMKPAALLLLLLAPSCAAIVGDDYVIVHEEPEPEPYLPADCQPVACTCAGAEYPYFCPSEEPIGCDGVSTVECPDLYWCCEF